MDAEATREHIELVSARIERAAPSGLRDHLLRAAAVHEERDPDRLPAGVAPVVLGFGELWKIASDADLAAYVGRHRAHLRELLLFELAHEGAATDGMRAVARHAGLEDEFAAWERAL